MSNKYAAIADRAAGSRGLEVVEVELRGGGKARMLRVFIDKPGGVTHEDCAEFSRELGTILDMEDVVPGNSYLARSFVARIGPKAISPVDFERFTGSRIKLTTRNPMNGNRHFEGKLERFENGRITLDVHGARKKPRAEDVPDQKLEIALADVEKANLVPEF